MCVVSFCSFLPLLTTQRAAAQDVQADCQKLRAAISDLARTFPDHYPKAARYLQRLDQIEGRFARGDKSAASDLELHFDATRLLFTQSDPAGWKIYEMNTDGSGLRHVSRLPEDVDAMDPCYLPNGRIVFGSTSSYQSVPCWHGWQPVSNLCVMDADGSHVRQLCFDQDHNFHPTVLPNGQVLYQRWDYTGISHIYLRQLMTMNPDGTRQRAVYGSNSWARRCASWTWVRT